MHHLDMVHLASVPAGFRARLLVAQLGAEGILWQIRGESSVYPLGYVDVLVAAESLEHARAVAALAADPGEPTPAPPTVGS